MAASHFDLALQSQQQFKFVFHGNTFLLIYLMSFDGEKRFFPVQEHSSENILIKWFVECVLLF